MYGGCNRFTLPQVFFCSFNKQSYVRPVAGDDRQMSPFRKELG